MDIKELGKRIKSYRIAAGHTQAELAELLHLVPQTVSKWERGLSAPDITKLSSLCSALSVSPSLLLDSTELETGEYMIAIDGGGTKTECLLFTDRGEIIKRTLSGGSNPNLRGMGAACAALRECHLTERICKIINGDGIGAGDVGIVTGVHISFLGHQREFSRPVATVGIDRQIGNGFAV